MKTILIIAGTRPEAIKLAPVVRELQRRDVFKTLLCATAQHRHMLDQVLRIFELQPDWDLDLMSPGQTLPALTARLFERLPETLAKANPSCVIVQGDTTTAFAGAVSAFYQKIPVAHVEAGLRTNDPCAPFPEEINRRLVSVVARWHFAPTERARQNLLREGVPDKHITVTGNTVIDALLMAAPSIHGAPPHLQAAPGQRLILVTGHRRESFGEGIRNVCEALAEIARAFPGDRIVYPMHPNPNVLEPAQHILGAIPNIHLTHPVEYPDMIALMMESHIIITDSGGIQEEAPALGKPVLVTREVTERPEAIEAGCAKLVGTETDVIVREASRLLSDQRAYSRMAAARNPFGDGHASEIIAETLEREM
ncbi:MAG: UDP-N-acetylglucosamine 2-epimerase (non-hydrolyzing) [bacterium]